MRLAATISLLSVLGSVAAFSQEPGKVRLMDYFYPTKTDAAWNYLQSREDGGYDARVVKLQDASYLLKLFSIQDGKLVEKRKNVVFMSTILGKFSGDKIIPGGTLYSYDFYGTGTAYALYGFDDYKENIFVRFSPGAVFPETLAIGQPVSVKTDVFNSEGGHGPDATVTAEVLEKTSVSVPAGDFPNCIHLRFTVSFSGGPKGVVEEWWAKGVGMVRNKSPRDNGPARITKLHSYRVSALDLVKTDGNFGAVSIAGPPAIKRLYVKNIGNKSIQGLNLSLTGKDNFTCKLLTPGKVLPGKVALIEATFDPNDLKGYRALLKIVDVGNPENTCSIELTGSGRW